MQEIRQKINLLKQLNASSPSWLTGSYLLTFSITDYSLLASFAALLLTGPLYGKGTYSRA